MRPDYEDTIRVRIQNIPLSVDDGIITRKLVLLGLDVITFFREKLRINNKLTNCQTGDRIATVKASSLKEPLTRFMQFGQFKAKVIHKGQNKKTLKCTKCLEDGHSQSFCPNDWKCLQCNKTGHKKGECILINESSDENPQDTSDTESSESSDEGQKSPPPTYDRQDTDASQSHEQPASAPTSAPSDAQKTETKVTDAESSPRRKKAKGKKKKSAARAPGQTSIGQFLQDASNKIETPARSRSLSRSIVRSPPTPPEDLCDNNKKYKKN